MTLCHREELHISVGLNTKQNMGQDKAVTVLTTCVVSSAYHKAKWR